MTLALGVDLGGTNARAAVVDRSTGRIVASEKQSWTDRAPEAVVGETAKLVNALAAKHSVAVGPLGVGFAGMLRGGVVVNAPNLGWRDVDFGGALSKATGRDVKLVNDLSAAAWGELSAGCARGFRDTFTVFVGTGVGSAIITNGALLTGATQVAAEFGHVKLIPQGGRRCGCGQDGCLEAYAGGAKLAEWMKEEGLDGTAVDLEPLAASGHTGARKMYEFVSSQLALAIANQITVLNPAVLVLGGGVLSRCPGMVQIIRETIAARSSVASRAGLKIELAALGDDSGLIGAALLS
ncbi:MAG: ROK family protein [Archangium sp.]|nr:ROK family protein [Archangium sp.]